MMVSPVAKMVAGAGVVAGGIAAGTSISLLAGTTDRDGAVRSLNMAGAVAGIAGLGIGALAPAAYRPFGVGIGVAGLAAFIGSQLLLPHEPSPSSE
jgi:hypothetical protein